MDGNDRGQSSSACMGAPERRVKPRSPGFLPPEIPPDPHLIHPPT